jgi:transposase InsO family protein
VTNEIVAYKASQSLDVTFVEETMDQLTQIDLDPNALINSDQGCHDSSKAFIAKVKALGLEQSMSRRGNCCDNSPIESFFGNMNDESNLIDCKTFDDILIEIDDYMDYYNNHRYQWNLQRMTPKLYVDKL